MPFLGLASSLFWRAPKPNGNTGLPPGTKSSCGAGSSPASVSSPFIMGASMPESEASCKKLDIRSSMFSRSWSDMPNCFIRSSTGWMCMARAQVRQ